VLTTKYEFGFSKKEKSLVCSFSDVLLLIISIVLLEDDGEWDVWCYSMNWTKNRTHICCLINAKMRSEQITISINAFFKLWSIWCRIIVVIVLLLSWLMNIEKGCLNTELQKKVFWERPLKYCLFSSKNSIPSLFHQENVKVNMSICYRSDLKIFLVTSSVI
jgi:hypothetical protein